MVERSEVSIWSPEQLSLEEGTLTHHLRNSLIWCDITEGVVYEKSFSGGAAKRHDIPVMPSAAGILDERSILVATEADFRVLDLESGALAVHAEFPMGGEMRSNDGRVHPSGAFWIGIMAKDGRSRPGAIWRLFKGSLTLMIDAVMIPNSICFTADGTTGYYADTPQRTIWQVPTDPATGKVIGEQKVFVSLSETDAGGPDGSVVDGEGNLWNARWGGGAVDVYDSSGARIRSFAVPASQPTCPAFIGPDLDQIVITSAKTGLAPKDSGESDGTVLQIHTPVIGRAECLVTP